MYKFNFLKRALLCMGTMIVWSLTAMANDGSFLVAGNQIVPIDETDISIKKEVLTLTFVPNNEELEYVMVDVYYEFYNPHGKRTLTMGFEAQMPVDEGRTPELRKNLEHPFIFDFKVEMNGSQLSYKNAVVESSLKGADKEPGRLVIAPSKKEFYENSVAYYFDAEFKEGINIVHHTYRYELSNSAAFGTYMDYWLCPAMRWAGGRIEDFTLRIGIDSKESVSMHLATENLDKVFDDDFKKKPLFYDQAPFRVKNGKAKITRKEDNKEDSYCIEASKCVVEWHKENFVPERDIKIFGIELPNSYESLSSTNEEEQNDSSVIGSEDKTEKGVKEPMNDGVLWGTLAFVVFFAALLMVPWIKRRKRS